jgi:hypothetical protein
LNPDAGEGNHISQIALDQNIRKGFLDSVEYRFDIFHIEAEMVQPGSNARVSPEQSETDGSVADVAHIGPALSRFISESRSDLFHSEDGFVEISHLFVTLGINRHVSNSREHKVTLSASKHGGMIANPTKYFVSTNQKQFRKSPLPCGGAQGCGDESAPSPLSSPVEGEEVGHF